MSLFITWRVCGTIYDPLKLNPKIPERTTSNIVDIRFTEDFLSSIFSPFGPKHHKANDSTMLQLKG
jgi:hypothetical protein